MKPEAEAILAGCTEIDLIYGLDQTCSDFLALLVPQICYVMLWAVVMGMSQPYSDIRIFFLIEYSSTL